MLLPPVQADWKKSTGAVNLDIDLLKLFRVAGTPADSASSGPSPAPDRVWLEYAYRKSHLVLQFLPTKLAEWIPAPRLRGRALEACGPGEGLKWLMLSVPREYYTGPV